MKLSHILVVFVILTVLCLIAAVLTALGVGLGLLLTVIMPDLPLGQAIVAGTIAVVAAAFILQRAMDSVSAQFVPDDEMPDESLETLTREVLLQRYGGSGRKRSRK